MSPGRPASVEPPDLRAWVVALAGRAGNAVMDIYRGSFDVETKDDDSPLTQADLTSHRVLRDALRERTPEWPVVSEEDAAHEAAEAPAIAGGAASGESPPVARPRTRTEPARTFWLIDPLDGTKEFVKRNGEFTVNVALIEDGRPVLGVVRAPALGVTYSAAAGAGAFRDVGDGEQRIQSRPPEGGRAAVVASRSHGNPDTEAFIAFLAEQFEVERTSIGSSLKLCRVADGTAHYYPRLAPTMAWDTAAAHAVVEQAGGTVVDARTRAPLRYRPIGGEGGRGWRNPPFLVLHGEDAWLPPPA